MQDKPQLTRSEPPANNVLPDVPRATPPAPVSIGVHYAN